MLFSAPGRSATFLLAACLAAAPLAARAQPTTNPAHPEEGAAQAPASGPAAARTPIEALYAALLDAMKRADALGFQGRYEVLAPAVAGSYDIPFMSELILGQAWRTLTP